MATRGAPKGNTNGQKGREWLEALRYALKSYESNDVKRGQALREIAKKVVEKALTGDKDSWQEIGNRLDGKPIQAIEGTGDNGALTIVIKGSDTNVL